MCSSINSITQNPVAGAYAHVIRGSGNFERWRVTHVSEDRTSCEIAREGAEHTLHASKAELYEGYWDWSVPGIEARINFTNVPTVGMVAEYGSYPEGIVRTTVAAVSEDGTEVTLEDGHTVTLAEYGGYPSTRFRAAR